MKKKILNLLGKLLGLTAAFYVGNFVICKIFGLIPFIGGYIVFVIYAFASIKVGQFLMDKLIKLALYLITKEAK